MKNKRNKPPQPQRHVIKKPLHIGIVGAFCFSWEGFPHFTKIIKTNTCLLHVHVRTYTYSVCTTYILEVTSNLCLDVAQIDTIPQIVSVVCFFVWIVRLVINIYVFNVCVPIFVCSNAYTSTFFYFRHYIYWLQYTFR